jgi:hypothetical protein
MKLEKNNHGFENGKFKDSYNMEYTKCDNYPRCTFVECECHQKMIFEQQLKRKKKVKLNTINQKIIKFEIVDGKPKPIYENLNQNNI